MSAEEEHNTDYIEDPYFNPNDSTSTPSLDELEYNVEYLDDERDILDNELELFDLRQLDFNELTYDSLTSINGDDGSINVEAEFFNVKRANAILRAFFKKDFKRQVRVTYCDLTKPYLAKLPKEHSFRKYLDITANEEAIAAEDHVPTDISALSVEEQEHQRSLWKAELAQVEDEIATLRTVLTSKVRRSAELKRNLGITVWKEISEDMNQSIKNVKESNVYQKTTSLIGGLTGGITNKIGQMRHSESFRSIEERVGSAYENVKTKVSTSRSGSIQSFDDAIQSRSGSVATSPTVAEEKPLS